MGDVKAILMVLPNIFNIILYMQLSLEAQYCSPPSQGLVNTRYIGIIILLIYTGLSPCMDALILYSTSGFFFCYLACTDLSETENRPLFFQINSIFILIVQKVSIWGVTLV